MLHKILLPIYITLLIIAGGLAAYFHLVVLPALEQGVETLVPEPCVCEEPEPVIEPEMDKG